jgi:RNA polymerase sigma factor (sigma-70 family)
LAQDEGLRALMSELDELPDDYREVILLARIEGLSTREVAEQMGKSREAVALLLHRAVKRFQQLHKLEEDL